MILGIVLGSFCIGFVICACVESYFNCKDWRKSELLRQELEQLNELNIEFHELLAKPKYPRHVE